MHGIRYVEPQSIERNPAAQGKGNSGTMVHAIDDLIGKNQNLSVRAGAQQLKLSKSTYDQIKVHELGIKAYRKEPAPKPTSIASTAAVRDVLTNLDFC